MGPNMILNLCIADKNRCGISPQTDFAYIEDAILYCTKDSNISQCFEGV